MTAFGLQVVLVLCRLRPQYTFSHSRKSSPPLLGMVAIAMALPPPSVHEIRLESDMFVTRINFDFRIAHCEPRYSRCSWRVTLSYSCWCRLSGSFETEGVISQFVCRKNGTLWPLSANNLVGNLPLLIPGIHSLPFFFHVFSMARFFLLSYF